MTRHGFGMVEAIVGTVILMIWTVGGGLNLLDTLWRDTGGRHGSLNRFRHIGFSSAASRDPSTTTARFASKVASVSMRQPDTVHRRHAAQGDDIHPPRNTGRCRGAGFMTTAGEAWWIYVWLALGSDRLFMVWATRRGSRRVSTASSHSARRACVIASSVCSSAPVFAAAAYLVIDSSRRTTHRNNATSPVWSFQAHRVFDTM